MAGNEHDKSAKRLISAVVDNAISSKGSAHNSPEHGATIMTKQAAERMKSTRDGNPCLKRSHSALWAADGPIPPDDGFDNLDLRIQKICAIETHLKTCFATVLASDFLSVQEALCMPLELLGAIEYFFKSWKLVSLDRFQELARRKLDDTKSSSLTKAIIIAMDKDLSDGMRFSFKNKPAKFSSSRIPASCAASSDGANADATINSTPTRMPDTPTPMPKTTAAVASAPPTDDTPASGATPNGKATPSSETTTANSNFVAARLPRFATSAKRNLSPNATPAPQRHGRQPSASTPLAQASETIARALASADAEHQRELKAAEDKRVEAEFELEDVKVQHKREVEALQAEHQRELEAARDERIAAEEKRMAAEEKRMAAEVEINGAKVEHKRELEALEVEHQRQLEEQRDEQRQQWEEEKSDLLSKKDEVEEDLEFLGEEYKALRTRSDELERRNEALGTWARELETEMELSKPKIRELEKSKASLQQEASDLRKESKAQKNDLEKKCAILEDRKKRLASNVDKLEDEKKEMQKKIDKLTQNKTSMENTVSGLQTDKEQLQKDRDESREQASAASRKYTALRATMTKGLNYATALRDCLLEGLDDKDPSPTSPKRTPSTK